MSLTQRNLAFGVKPGYWDQPRMHLPGSALKTGRNEDTPVGVSMEH